MFGVLEFYKKLKSFFIKKKMIYLTKPIPKVEINMSRFNNINKSHSVSNKMGSNKAFCGACQKAGKTMEEYTSHWTRSKPGTEGVVTCPLILASNCGYCHETGHWTKFCPMLVNKTVSKSVVVVEKQVKIMANPVLVVAHKKRFDMLYMSDDEEEDEVEVVTKKPKTKETTMDDQRFPPLTLKKKVNLSILHPTETKSWSSVVQTPLQSVVIPTSRPLPMKKKIINWADDDSDSDEDDYYLPTGLYAV
jgi:hypothetical protein